MGLKTDNNASFLPTAVRPKGCTKMPSSLGQTNKYSYFLTTNVCICASYLITFYAVMLISTDRIHRIDICIKIGQKCE